MIVSVKVVVEYSGRLEIGTTVTGSSNGAIIFPEVGNGAENADPTKWEVEVLTYEEKRWKAQNPQMPKQMPKPPSAAKKVAVGGDDDGDDDDDQPPGPPKSLDELYLTHEDKALKTSAGREDVVAKVSAAIKRALTAVEVSALGQTSDAPAPDGEEDGGDGGELTEEVRQRVAEMRVAGRPERVKEALAKLASDDASTTEIDLTYTHLESDAVDELFQLLARTSCPLTSVKLAQGVITGLCASHVQPLVARIAGGGLADLTSVVLDRKVVDGDAAMSAILQGVQLIRKDLKVTLV